jgi:HTH-type transcriptional regulator, bacterioopsin transcriptional activator and related proteins
MPSTHRSGSDVSTLVVTVDSTESVRTGRVPPTDHGEPTTREGRQFVILPDLESLHRTFTPQAIELLDAIRRECPASISETARLVDRDVKNVHSELGRLEECGVLSFVEERGAKRPVVRFDELRIDLGLGGPYRAGERARDHRPSGRVAEDVYSRITDGVLELDAAARILYVNERAEELLSRSAEELIGSVLWKQFPEAIGTRVEEQYRRAMGSREPVVYEEYVPPLNTWFDIRSYPSDIGLSVYFRDITERKRQEERLEYQRSQLATINHLNWVIQEITHLAIDSTSREEIERRVCSRMVETEFYVFAWTGTVERGSEAVTPNHTAGGEETYLDESRLSIDPDDPHGRGPTGTAIRTREPQFAHDLRTETDYDPWRSRARERGFESSAAIPILHDGLLYSVLNVYSDRTNAFTKPEREALAHLGEVIGHAMHSAEQRKGLVSESVVELDLRNPEIARTMTGGAVEPDAELSVSIERTVPTGDGRVFQFVTVSGLSVERFEEVAVRRPAVEEVSLVDRGGTDALFRLTVSGPTVSETVAAYGGRVRSLRTTAKGTRIVVELPMATSVRTVLDALNRAFPGTELVGVRSTTREPRTSGEIRAELLEPLTERQRTALETAYFSGYFDWPRTSTGEEVAETLDIAAPTFTNHLRAAERRLLRALLAE